MKNYSNYKGRRAISKFSPEEVVAFMKIINFEFYSLFDLNYPNKEKKSIKKDKSYNSFSCSEEENFKIYYFKYTNYILNEFDSSKVNMMISYINNKSIPQDYKQEIDFEYKMINLIKSLMMNEIEIAYFTLLLDKLGLRHETIDNWIYFSLLGIVAKNSCLKDNDTILLINIFSKKYPKFNEIYSNFIRNEKPITIDLLNIRFMQLSKPKNTYCRKNYIILDSIIDKILNLSHPYLKDKSKDSKNIMKNKNNLKDVPLKINEFDNWFLKFNKRHNDINFEEIKKIAHNFINNLNSEDYNDFFNYYTSDDLMKLEDI